MKCFIALIAFALIANLAMADFRDFTQDVGDAVGSGIAKAGNKTANAADDVKNAGEYVGDKVANKTSDAYNDVKDAGQYVGDKVANKTSDAVDDVREAGERTRDAASQVGQGFF